jgi:hypothetical protein
MQTTHLAADRFSGILYGPLYNHVPEMSVSTLFEGAFPAYTLPQAPVINPLATAVPVYGQFPLSYDASGTLIFQGPVGVQDLTACAVTKQGVDATIAWPATVTAKVYEVTNGPAADPNTGMRTLQIPAVSTTANATGGAVGGFTFYMPQAGGSTSAQPIFLGTFYVGTAAWTAILTDRYLALSSVGNLPVGAITTPQLVFTYPGGY